MKENKDKTEDIGSRPSKAVWTKDLLHTFCDICIQAISMGLRPGSYFSSKGWKYLITTFKQTTGLSMTRIQLKNKWDSSRKDWRIWKQLNQQTGVGWDDEAGTLKATNEWWTKTAKVIKGCEKFRRAGMDPELCKKFDVMFLNTVPTRNHAWTPSSHILLDTSGDGGGNDTASDDNLIEESGDSEDGTHFVQGVNDMANRVNSAGHNSRSDRQGSSKRKNRHESSKQDPKKRRKEVGAKIISLFERLLSIMESSSHVTSKLRDEVGCSIAKVMREVHSLPDIEIGNDLHLFASEFFLNRDRREMWNAMGSLEAKQTWLNKMFEKNGK